MSHLVGRQFTRVLFFLQSRGLANGVQRLGERRSLADSVAAGRCGERLASLSFLAKVEFGELRSGSQE